MRFRDFSDGSNNQLDGQRHHSGWGPRGFFQRPFVAFGTVLRRARRRDPKATMNPKALAGISKDGLACSVSLALVGCSVRSPFRLYRWLRQAHVQSVERALLYTPPVEELAKQLEAVLLKHFRHASVTVVDCPDLQ